MRHYITDQHPDHLGEVWLCNLTTGEPVRHLPGVQINTFALTASGESNPSGLTNDVARVLIAAGDFAEVLTADAATLTPWEGTIAFVDQPTDDSRQLDSGGGTFRTFPLPHMAQMATSWGHDGAMIVGRIDSAEIGNGEVTATGVYDTSEWAIDAARLCEQQMLDRVSIDLGAAEVETEILEYDEDGWPTDWLDHFTAWQIAGLTQVNISAFADARIRVSGPVPGMPPEGDMVASAQAIVDRVNRASARSRLRNGFSIVAADTVIIPTAAPAEWFAMAEPAPGEEFALGGIGAEWLIAQNRDGALAMPLAILDDGRVAGHIAFWGQCHVGFPGRCISPPEGNTYARFHTGYHVADNGTSIATGTLTAGCDHAATNLRAPDATSHYAHNGVAWADVRITNGVYGPWACGVLRSDVTPEQIAVLRGGALSGDWRSVDGRLEMIATLAVNTAGFPIAREAITAAALEWFDVSTTRQRTEDGEVFALVASNQVTRCVECAQRAAASLTDEQRFARLEREVKALKSVVQPSLAAAADFYRERIAASD